MTPNHHQQQRRQQRRRRQSAMAATVLVLGILACSCRGAAAAGAGRVACATNADCAEKHFCHLPDTACVGPGLCEPIPEICTMDYTPVCGCDGVTYPNRCGAFARGASYRFLGECENPPQPQQPQAVKQQQEAGGPGRRRRGLGWKDVSALFAASADFLSLRSKRDGDSDKAAPSMPMPMPMPPQQAPLPATTTNEEAAAGGAAASGIGGVGGETTRIPCGSRGMRPCDEGYFCEFVDGRCGETDTGGFCSRTPVGCPRIFRPVCGCDKITHANACVARSQAVSVRHEGECATDDGPPGAAPTTGGGGGGGGGGVGAGAGVPSSGGQPLPPHQEEERPPSGHRQDCGGLMGKGCPAGQACLYAMEAHCGAADQTGVCMEPPTFCTLNYQPVCGCDGNTYSNSCHAHAKGVSVAAEGPCDAPRTPEEAAQQDIQKKDAMLARLRMHGGEEVADAAENGGV